MQNHHIHTRSYGTEVPFPTEMTNDGEFPYLSWQEQLVEALVLYVFYCVLALAIIATVIFGSWYCHRKYQRNRMRSAIRERARRISWQMGQRLRPSVAAATSTGLRTATQTPPLRIIRNPILSQPKPLTPSLKHAGTQAALVKPKNVNTTRSTINRHMQLHPKSRSEDSAFPGSRPARPLTLLVSEERQRIRQCEEQGLERLVAITAGCTPPAYVILPKIILETEV